VSKTGPVEPAVVAAMPTTSAERRQLSQAIVCFATVTGAVVATLLRHATSKQLLFTAPTQPKHQLLRQGIGLVSHGLQQQPGFVIENGPHDPMGNAKSLVSASSLVQSRWAPATANALLIAAVAAAVCQRSTTCRAKRNNVVRPETAETRAERVKGARTVPGGRAGQRFFSLRNREYWDFIVHPRKYFRREWKNKDIGYASFLVAMHVGAAMAPFYFTWDAFAVFVVGYIITGLFGITLSYHRQLAHKAFRTPKALEYFFAYCGALALQSHPINWVSSHRWHHGACETEDDVHSPLDGFWWSHAGWLLDQKNTWMRSDKSNVPDLKSQRFYQFLAKTYPLHAIILPMVGLYTWGGLPYLFWGFFACVIWVWHITWAVNSVSHVWGFQSWNTGDQSMNNWIVGLLAFGEGWHNNHHAFETSCRHGLDWWQVDFTWYFIKLLNFMGLADRLKYPTASQRKRVAWPETAVAA
jgi:stearoyl-CoA desaturase (delta-9 desaturase)